MSQLNISAYDKFQYRYRLDQYHASQTIWKKNYSIVNVFLEYICKHIFKKKILYDIIRERIATGGRSLSCKGGDHMITYAELFQFGILVVEIVTLCVIIHKR